jgi:membrane-associated protein
MPTIIHAILPLILLYKYGALFAITFIAACIIPIPPGSLIMASAAFASQGYLNVWWVFVVATLGNVAGDNASYWLARIYGKRILHRIGLRSTLESPRYASIERRVINRPGFIIFISRFEVFTNLAVNIMAGLGKVKYKKFLIYAVIGEVFQVAIYGSIGYLFGQSWEALSGIIGRGLLIILILAVLVLIVFWKKIWNKR